MKPTILITSEILVNMDACSRGLAAFNSVYPNGLFVTDWTREEQVRVLQTSLRRFVCWAWAQGVLPMWSMSNMDLSGANLSEANLCRADFICTNLSGANLTHTQLIGARLLRADLTGALRSPKDYPIPGWTVVNGKLQRDNT